MESTNVGDIEEGNVDHNGLPPSRPNTSVQKKEKKEEGNVDAIEILTKTLLRGGAPLLVECRIFRVPEVLRSQNKAAYEPNIVSIGPIHRGKKQFKFVEKVKKGYFMDLLSHLKIPVDCLIKRVLDELEQPARTSYADNFDDLDQTKFAKMLILDGCYLIQLFLQGPDKLLEEDEDAAITFNASFILEYLYHDLLLLENQLPWCVLEFFYKLIEGDNTKNTLTEKVLDFFKPSVAAEAAIFRCPNSDVEIFHILDLIRTALIQEEPRDPTQSSTTKKEQLKSHLPLRIPTATTLKKEGVQLKKGPQGCILNIKFNDGVFTIPPLTIDEKTNAFFRNLMAYEQCSPKLNYRITSYVVLISNLINTTKDVDLLGEKEIVVNWLSAKDASKLFNEIYKDTTINEFNYRKLCKDVDQYHKSLWGRFRKKFIYRLKRDYFDTPWSTISVFAAFVLLVLTFLQTIYTMLPSDPAPR